MDKRTKARLVKLETAILNACKRRRDEPSAMMMPIKVIIEQQVGYHMARFKDHQHASVEVVLVRETHICDAYRVGKNMGDDFFELKLMPEHDKIAAQVENAEDTNFFIPIPATSIVFCYEPREVQRIIRLVDAI